ncbi:MAG: hypothetical protein H7X86_14380, partial [Gorillibacterium sp.]|nr:hypothetical protein [Gorillibacterium sp.]
LSYLIDAVKYAIETLYDEQKGLFGSDTVGETTLKGSIFFGYDSVDGSIDPYRCPNENRNGKGVVYCYSLYQNVNMYNVLRMMEVLVKASPDLDLASAVAFRTLADQLGERIVECFPGDSGHYKAGLLVLEDGEQLWIEDFRELDLWEYAWAVSLGPFYPDLGLALASSRFVMEEWPKTGTYGLCPWNTLSRLLKQYVLDDLAFEHMLEVEFRDALTYTETYPMVGATTEYAHAPHPFRGLPFSTGSLLYTLHACVLQSLPLGLAIRGSKYADQVSRFQYRNARIDVSSIGDGEAVGSWSMNGSVVLGTLQIPESKLYHGKNKVEITRAAAHTEPRLFSSTAILLEVEADDFHYVYQFRCPTACELIFENFEHATGLSIYDDNGAISCEVKRLEDTFKTQIRFNCGEAVTVELKLR